MALEGSLKDFGIADILQLIYFQRKTGVLEIDGRDDRVRLGFAEGNIVFAESRKRDAEDRLGKILLKRKLIDTGQLEEAVEEQKTSNAKIGSIILKKGFADKAQIEGIIRAQITEIVVHLFGWKEGHYDFQPIGIPLDKDIPISMDTQHFLMEGARIVDEWSMVSDKIALENMYEPTGKGSTEGLTEQQQALIEHIDGESDVSTLSGIVGREAVEVSKDLISLESKGLIRIKRDRKAEAIEQVRERVEVKAVPLHDRLPEAVAIIALAAALIAGILFGSLGSKKMRAYEDLNTLRFKLEVERQKTGVYPQSLEGLHDTMDLWGNPYVYWTDGQEFIVISPGPDGVRDNGDDLY